jgi:hypothetical protein
MWRAVSASIRWLGWLLGIGRRLAPVPVPAEAPAKAPVADPSRTVVLARLRSLIEERQRYG